MEEKLISTLSGDFQYKKTKGGLKIYKTNYEVPWVEITEEALIEDYMKLVETFSDLDILLENKDSILKILK